MYIYKIHRYEYFSFNLLVQSLKYLYLRFYVIITVEKEKVISQKPLQEILNGCKFSEATARTTENIYTVNISIILHYSCK